MSQKILYTMSIYTFAFAVGMVCSLLVNLVSVWLAVGIIVGALVVSLVYYLVGRNVQ